MGSFSKNIALLALGFWLGCCILSAVVVAPTVFYPNGKSSDDVHAAGTTNSMISKEVAGSIMGKIFKRVYLIGYITLGTSIFFLLAASFGDPKIAKGPQRALVLCVLALGLNLASDWWISDQIYKVRSQIANADVSEGPRLKKTLDQWHEASKYVSGAAVLFGIGAAICLLPAAHGGGSKKPASKGKK